MIRTSILAAGLAVLTGTSALACMAPPGAASMEREIGAWINAERRAKGLRPLSFDNALGKAASSHACDMARMDVLSHKGSNGGTLKNRLRTVSYRLRTAVENIGRSVDSGSDVARRLWIDSPKHRDNLMNGAISEMGIGLAQDGLRTYYVFVGGAPK